MNIIRTWAKGNHMDSLSDFPCPVHLLHQNNAAKRIARIGALCLDCIPKFLLRQGTIYLRLYLEWENAIKIKIMEVVEM